jgi:hypothetical protein
VIQFGSEFLITAEVTERTQRKTVLENNAQNLSILCGLGGKFLPDEKYPIAPKKRPTTQLIYTTTY